MSLLTRMNTIKAWLRNELIPTEFIVERLYSSLELSPMNKCIDSDVYIVGYPKSGNTWFQNLAAGAVFGLSPEFAPDALIQDLVPDVHARSFYRRYQTPMFFKSHHLPRPEYRRVVYLLRDGRDVMVSFVHHLRALHGDNVDFLDMVKNNTYMDFGPWQAHVEQWLSNPYHADLIVIKYEELHADPLDALRRFCIHAQLDRSDELLTRAITGSSFNNMRDREIQYGWALSHWPKDKFFVRRGKIGSYIDEMPAPVLEAFLREAGSTLSRYGYE